MEALSPQPLKIGRYEHYKGMPYWVHGIVIHSETLEELVYYECLYENDRAKFWVRPRKMFQEKVTVDGVEKPRFRYVSEN